MPCIHIIVTILKIANFYEFLKSGNLKNSNFSDFNCILHMSNQSNYRV